MLFCTSTLLEGVNLPADKIFVVSAKKADEQLTSFEFRNLIGRAGRLDQHLCGLVYCIQTPDDKSEDWIEAYRQEERKRVKPTIGEKLASHFDEIRDLLASGTATTDDAFNPSLKSTAVILRSRNFGGPSTGVVLLESPRLSRQPN